MIQVIWWPLVAGIGLLMLLVAQPVVGRRPPGPAAGPPVPTSD